MRDDETVLSARGSSPAHPLSSPSVILFYFHGNSGFISILYCLLMFPKESLKPEPIGSRVDSAGPVAQHPVVKLIESLQARHGIREREDWYRVRPRSPLFSPAQLSVDDILT